MALSILDFVLHNVIQAVVVIGRTFLESDVSHLRELLRHRSLMIGGSLLIILLVVAVLAPWVVPYSPLKTDMAKTLAPVSAEHWLGTDQYGRDVLSRVLMGTKVSLQVAFAVVGLSLTAGTFIGAVAGFAGGWIERITLVVIDDARLGLRMIYIYETHWRTVFGAPIDTFVGLGEIVVALDVSV